MGVAASSHICPLQSKLACSRTSQRGPAHDDVAPDLSSAVIVYRAPDRDLVYGAHTTAAISCARVDPADAYAGRGQRRRIDIEVRNQDVEIFRVRRFSAHGTDTGE